MGRDMRQYSKKLFIMSDKARPTVNNRKFDTCRKGVSGGGSEVGGFELFLVASEDHNTVHVLSYRVEQGC